MDKDFIFKLNNKEISFTELFAIFFSLTDKEKLIVEDVNPIGVIEVKVINKNEEASEKVITKIKQFLNSVETVRGDDDKYSLYPNIGYKCSEVDDFLDKLAKEGVNL